MMDLWKISMGNSNSIYHHMTIAIIILFMLSACVQEQERISAATTIFSPTEMVLEVTPTSPSDVFEGARQRMVKHTIEARGITNADVLRAMNSVERHKFVTDQYLLQAYADHPLPIGYGQTISQPYIVALMTDLLNLKPGERVLEIGSGSGYQAAVLAELGYVDVYTIEIIPELANIAESRLSSLGYSGVHIKQGDGYFGWEEFAPFDAIIVTAAPDHLPAPLVKQLSEGGRIVIPIGPPGGYQTLWKFIKEEGELKAINMGGVAFVPFTGEGVEKGSSETSP